MSVRDDPVLFLQQGKGKTTGGSSVGGGSAITTTHVHRLNGPEHTLATDDDRLNATGGEPGLLPKLSGITTDTLHGDGTWSTDAGSSGDAELNIEGGQSVIKAHGSMGSTEPFDPSDGNVHTGTLNANCAFTLNAPAGAGAAILELWLTQDGTGGWVITWPGSVTVQGALDTTAGTTSRVLLDTVDGGTTWIATVVGGGSSVSALDDLTDVTITSPASGDRLRYNGSAWVNANLHEEPMIASDGSIQTDGLLNPQMHEVAW